MRMRLFALLAMLALAGCSTLPRSAPTVSEVLPDDGARIAVVDIGMDTQSPLPADFAPLPDWSLGDGPPRAAGVQPGDVLQITVFEVGYALFSGQGLSSAPDSQPTASGSGYRFPPLRVPEDGVIALPFAGQLDVAGMSGNAIARAFENRLEGLSQNAQVLVSVEPGPRRSVVLIGDVEEPGRVVLSEDGERLLDVIALAGGPAARPQDVLVTVSRSGMASTARLSEIAVSAPANIRLAAGDRIELTRSIRTLTVLGAASTVSEVTFDDAGMTLSEALARAGGPEATRADPTGVFIFRQIANPHSAAAGEALPVIYRLDLLDPQSYFAAQNFAMRERDVVLIADASGARLEQFLRMVNALAAPVVTVDVLTR